ncbi:hypothetical protein DFJ74DRAFT_472936 [Hyaloraphidium curvatum]|nr:hypothetical protein DFJ74DRAFT_472936 [Hyaloraphidium curvatum]
MTNAAQEGIISSQTPQTSPSAFVANTQNARRRFRPPGRARRRRLNGLPPCPLPRPPPSSAALARTATSPPSASSASRARPKATLRVHVACVEQVFKDAGGLYRRYEASPYLQCAGIFCDAGASEPDHSSDTFEACKTYCETYPAPGCNFASFNHVGKVCRVWSLVASCGPSDQYWVSVPGDTSLVKNAQTCPTVPL